MQARINTLIAPNLSPADYEEITLLADEAARLYVEVENWPGHGRVLDLLGEVKRMQQHYEEAKHYYVESVQEMHSWLSVERGRRMPFRSRLAS